MKIKLRMEMGNVSKRQQPDQIKNSRGSPCNIITSKNIYNHRVTSIIGHLHEKKNQILLMQLLIL